MWWFVFPIILTKILMRGVVKTLLGKELPFSLLMLVFVGIYSFFYAGSAELRFRGVLYVLLSTILINDWLDRQFVETVLEERNQMCSKGKALFVYSVLLGVIAIPAIVFSF
ncbi:MAG: hypothetical protein ABIM21_02620 [candidate division WOR-3 bacterium]